MEYLVLSTGDAGMAALVVLIAVVAADELKAAVFVYLHLVYVADADALALKLGGFAWGRFLAAIVYESVFAQPLLFGLLLLGLALKHYHDAVAGHEVFVLSYLLDESSSFWPFAAVGGTGIPGKGEEVAARHHDISVLNHSFLVLLVEEQSPVVSFALVLQQDGGELAQLLTLLFTSGAAWSRAKGLKLMASVSPKV